MHICLSSRPLVCTVVTNITRDCSCFVELKVTLDTLREASEENRLAAAQVLAKVVSGEHKLEVDELCKQLLTEEEKETMTSIPSINNLGSRSDSVSEMGPTITKRIKSVGLALMRGVARRIKGGNPDVKGVMELLQGPSGREGAVVEDDVLFQKLAEVIADAVQMGERRTANQFLQVIVACKSSLGLTNKKLEQKLTRLVKLNRGDPVKVIIGQFKKLRDAEVVEVEGEGDRTDEVVVTWSDGVGEGMSTATVLRSSVIADIDARVIAYAITKAGKGSRDTFFGGYRFVIEPRQVQRINFRAFNFRAQSW